MLYKHGDLIDLFQMYRAGNVAQGKQAATALIKAGRAIPVLSGDPAALGVRTTEITSILPHNGSHACYVANAVVALKR